MPVQRLHLEDGTFLVLAAVRKYPGAGVTVSRVTTRSPSRVEPSVVPENRRCLYITLLGALMAVAFIFMLAAVLNSSDIGLSTSSEEPDIMKTSKGESARDHKTLVMTVPSVPEKTSTAPERTLSTETETRPWKTGESSSTAESTEEETPTTQRKTSRTGPCRDDCVETDSLHFVDPITQGNNKMDGIILGSSRSEAPGSSQPFQDHHPQQRSVRAQITVTQPLPQAVEEQKWTPIPARFVGRKRRQRGSPPVADNSALNLGQW